MASQKHCLDETFLLSNPIYMDMYKNTKDKNIILEAILLFVTYSLVKVKKFPKSWTLENQNLKLAVCLENIEKSKLNTFR